MNKFQVETLEPKWMGFLKKDMEKYADERETLMSKLSEPTPLEEMNIVGKQFVWTKE